MSNLDKEFIGGVPASLFDINTPSLSEGTFKGLLSRRGLNYEASTRHIYIVDEKAPRFSFRASLGENGLVTLSVHTKGFDGDMSARHPDLYAGKLAKTAIATFTSRGYKVNGIHDIWYLGAGKMGDNGKKYLDGLENNLSPEDAVWQTWTGLLALSLGFEAIKGEVKTVNSVFTGQAEKVVVDFVKE